MRSDRKRARRSTGTASDGDIERVRLFEAARADAERPGCLSGKPTQNVSVRATRALAPKANRGTGLSPSTELVEIALAALPTPDAVSVFMAKTYGTLGKKHSLDF
jgi:hypothetical protein